MTLCQTLEQLGLDYDAARLIAGLSRSQLETPSYLIRSVQELAFINAVLAANSRPDLAYLVGPGYHFDVIGIWALALICSKNLRQACQIAQEFY
ncbi:AraC family transcriptional regulator ligand-binding domain-containing protein [Zhongshania sp.]|uniref:AraC family transcriptional regulator ligand-binding domain-containing protein n=1 Tax=Zhongshania sp. TaxID=1971902 RepID=UPI0035656440